MVLITYPFQVASLYNFSYQYVMCRYTAQCKEFEHLHIYKGITPNLKGIINLQVRSVFVTSQFPIHHQVRQYLIVEIYKEMYGFHKCSIASQLPLRYYLLQKLVVKLDWYNVLSQLKIYSKPVYMHQKSFYQILKNPDYKISSASLTALHKTHQPQAYGPSFFSQCR